MAAGTHALTTLTSFNYLTSGANPSGHLAIDAAGNLYGTAQEDGAGRSAQGTVFEWAAGTRTLSMLATFTGTNGSNPVAGLTADAAGNLYGTTAGGGANDGGTAFEVAVGTHALTTLAAFDDNSVGYGPFSGLTADAAGNLYGTTGGSVFELTGTGFAVPEPASAAAVAVAAGLNLLRRRRSR